MEVSPHQLADQAYIDRESIASALNEIADTLSAFTSRNTMNHNDAGRVPGWARAVLDLTRALEIIDGSKRVSIPPMV